MSKPPVSCLWGCGESVNPQKLYIHEVHWALSSRPKRHPDPLPIYQDFLLLSSHTPENVCKCIHTLYLIGMKVHVYTVTNKFSCLATRKCILNVSIHSNVVFLSSDDRLSFLKLSQKLVFSNATKMFKGTISSRSEQTFNRAWNRCPSLRWTQWLKIYWLIYAASTVIHMYDLILWGIIFSHWVNLNLVLRFHALLIVTILSL